MTLRLSMKSALFGLSALALSASGALADQLSDIQAAGKIVAATEMHYAPFDMLEKGEYVGFDRDLFDEVAKELGVKPEYQDLPWTSILPGLEVDKFDFVLAPVTMTAERAERYAFTLPISDSTVAFVQRTGGDMETPEDAKGKTVGVQKGTAQQAQLEAYAETIGGIKIKEYGTPDEAYADLMTRRLDAVAGSAPLLDYLAKSRPEQFSVVKPPFGKPTYFAWVARQGEGDTLVAAINEALIKIQEDGRMAKIQEKWFGTATELPQEMPEL
ncbi:transporter substrate-binding domain-containing protein [Rhodovulum sulfidophilum]|uniref:transporter substrate-binding domain-containing protein n=1 Tax=Rhodovulum sulfidophilum TaxID=35806 RepID=UPI00191403DD|nr:transporter substrate-binding domain-containing protein [Rhodovulum sulfidophilum]MBK5922978.1 amino acid ABC transporter [Rhodovulum sulfidophilum]MBL3565478.1 transporter substrate-binding domain-containing protein [Rhodovulum sulfidophilum]MBL3574057.1 transporter substrate-binding domain-containing protein [Rhodovulum sulfidophilum]MBL3584774.1 transporter substrate-binding domain-containing protein [Rhodovulum sulfidophilum]MBL3595823.1 transporter substrate-binding domain-containing p